MEAPLTVDWTAIIALSITILGSTGGAVLMVGRYVGRIENQVHETRKDLQQYIEANREFHRSVNRKLDDHGTRLGHIEGELQRVNGPRAAKVQT